MTVLPPYSRIMSDMHDVERERINHMMDAQIQAAICSPSFSFKLEPGETAVMYCDELDELDQLFNSNLTPIKKSSYSSKGDALDELFGEKKHKGFKLKFDVSALHRDYYNQVLASP